MHEFSSIYLAEFVIGIALGALFLTRSTQQREQHARWSVLTLRYIEEPSRKAIRRAFARQRSRATGAEIASPRVN